MRHGWFAVPGLQTGDRTFDDQAAGLDAAFAECAGKTVLDIGCAEGLISHEFARQGAASVHGIELLEEHLIVARQLGEGLACTWQQAHIETLITAQAKPKRYDIVLALAVIHKVHNMRKALTWAARSSSGLLLLRTGNRYDRGVMVSKRDGSSVMVAEILAAEGFALERTVTASPKHRERVEYWRRAT